MNTSPLQALHQTIASSELGNQWIDDPLMNQDIWLVEELGYTQEESKITGIRNIYFQNFSLPWLKLLAKLTALASAREKCSLGVTRKRINYLK